MGRNRLEGNIPRDLQNLRDLNYADFSANMLNGTIPNDLGELRNLNSL